MFSLTPTRMWVAGTVAVCLLLSVVSYLLLIAPERAQAADFDRQTVETLASNDVLEVRVAQLRAQFAELPMRRAELAAVKQAMPESASMPTLLRDLDYLASTSGVTLMSLTPGAGVVVPSSTVAAAAEAPAAGAAPAEGSAEATDPAAVAPVAPVGDLLVSIPVNLVVVGTFAGSEQFLKTLQTEMARALLVSGLTVTAETAAAEATGGKPAVEVGDVTMTLTGSVFVLRPASAVPALVTPPTTVTP